MLYERPAARGLQYFDGVGDSDVVGKPYRHVAADMQARPPSPHALLFLPIFKPQLMEIVIVEVM